MIYFKWTKLYCSIDICQLIFFKSGENVMPHPPLRAKPTVAGPTQRMRPTSAGGLSSSGNNFQLYCTAIRVREMFGRLCARSFPTLDQHKEWYQHQLGACHLQVTNFNDIVLPYESRKYLDIYVHLVSQPFVKFLPTDHLYVADTSTLRGKLDLL